MRKLEAVLVFTLLLVMLSGFANAAEQPITICASQVSKVIEQSEIKGQFAEAANILTSKSYKPQWDDAIAGIGKVSDAQGAVQALKIFAVPFVDAGGEIKATIIGGIFHSESGIQIHEFITTVGIDAETISHGGGSIIPIEQSVIPSIEVKELQQAIIGGNRSEIWDYIIRSIGIKDSGIAIRTAFETSGYACSIPPEWFPEKGIWYAATCIRKSQR